MELEEQQDHVQSSGVSNVVGQEGKLSHFLAETASAEGPLDEEIHRFGQDTEIMPRPSVDEAAEEASPLKRLK